MATLAAKFVTAFAFFIATIRFFVWILFEACKTWTIVFRKIESIGVVKACSANYLVY